MKKFVLSLLTTFAAGFFLVAGAFGAEMQNHSMHQSLSAQSGSGTLHSAKEFIGTEVRDANGNDIGEVKDLQIDMDRGIIYAAVENDKLTQVDKTILVPLGAFDTTHADDYVSLPVTEENLAKYPKRDAAMDNETYGRNLHQFYGITYPWGGHEVQSKGKDVLVPLGGH